VAGGLNHRQPEEVQMSKFVVQIDPDLRDLIPGFLAKKRDDSNAILSATHSHETDFDALSRIGHRLKGEGGSYGLDAISAYGAEIELAARSRDVETIRRCARELSDYLDSLDIVYE
jgi:HPt (histidine-containing phosphotransfer) domain-containing protein